MYIVLISFLHCTVRVNLYILYFIIFVVLVECTRGLILCPLGLVLEA